jgi:hypothetical protein
MIEASSFENVFGFLFFEKNFYNQLSVRSCCLIKVSPQNPIFHDQKLNFNFFFGKITKNIFLKKN